MSKFHTEDTFPELEFLHSPINIARLNKITTGNYLYKSFCITKI